MKKTLSLVLALSMLVAVLSVVGCKPAQGTVKLGLGSVTSIAKSKDATAEAPAEAQADTTIVAVVLDKDGKILDVSIDTAQTKVEFDADMKVTSDKEAAIMTKKELGHAYGMSERSEIGKEWFEQIAALEDWMIGKTVEEVKNMKVKERDASHTHVPDVPELTSSVTISVQDYIAALEKAAANAVEVKEYSTMGLGIIVSIAGSKDATDTTTAQAQVDTTMAATTFDKDGNVAGAIIDVAQSRVPYDAEGKADKTANVLTKKELKEDYGMKEKSGIGKEWYEQVEAFEKWMTGKPFGDVVMIKVTEKGNPDIPELTSSVTISVESLIAAVQEAYRYKK